MDGIIIVNKPKGWTSFDVVAKIRNLTGTKRVGHSGTLDPMATGLLLVFLGKATKSVKYFLDGDKGYLGEMVLGIKTDSGDADGKVVSQPSPKSSLPQVNSQLPLPEGEGVNDCQTVTMERVRAVFDKFRGEISQIPPMYSAVKVGGQRLYKLARKGIEVKREPRKVTIYELNLNRLWKPDQVNRDVQSQVYLVDFSVLCSKGTYIRQLVMDIGDDLGCGAHLSKLERIYSHPFHISQALEMDTIVTLAKIDQLSTVLISPEEMIEAKANG
jgi:tRNA pseudouridine55 synthase